MRTGASVSRWLMWIVTVICVFFQALALIGIIYHNNLAASLDKADQQYNFVPLLIASVVMMGTVFLYQFCKKLRIVSLIVSAGVSVAMVLIALDMKEVFHLQFLTSGQEVGLTTWDMIYRHMSPVLITAAMIASFIFERHVDKLLEVEAVKKGAYSYALDGKSIFADSESTITGVVIPNEDSDGRPLTQKERRRLRKEAEKMKRHS